MSHGHLLVFPVAKGETTVANRSMAGRTESNYRSKSVYRARHSRRTQRFFHAFLVPLAPLDQLVRATSCAFSCALRCDSHTGMRDSRDRRSPRSRPRSKCIPRKEQRSPTTTSPETADAEHRSPSSRTGAPRTRQGEAASRSRTQDR